MLAIDLNCDLGEGGDFDEQLMPLISSCNIACGGHFGDRESVRKAVLNALEEKVLIGAHPAYPDPDHFGRLSIAMSLEKLQESLKQQIYLVKEEVEKVGGKLHHVKPHGALYNDLKNDREKAALVLETILKIDSDLILFVPPKSAIKKMTKGKLKTWTEGFADRNYEADFSLVSRKNKDAVLHRKETIFKRVFQMISEGEIEAINGAILQQKMDTICVHSDTENSVEILQFLNQELRKKTIQIGYK